MKINSFSPVASRYSKEVTPYRLPQYLTLIHALGLVGDEHVIDIGSGPGELSSLIASELNDDGFLYGIDLSDNMVKLARKLARNHGLANVRFGQGDVLDLKFKDNSFDVVVSSNAYPWVADRPQFLREVYRVLRPGGRFLLVALSNLCYREFSSVFRQVSKKYPGLFPEGRPFTLMGAKLHSQAELAQAVTKRGFEVSRSFVMTTEEPITTQAYLDRVNAIVNENYLDHLNPNGERTAARAQIRQAFEGRNGKLKITESSVFVVAQKPVTDTDYSI